MVAYSVPGSLGSNPTCVDPTLNGSENTSENEAPPSVDSYTPHVGPGGMSGSAAGLIPAKPIEVAITMWSGSVGSIATEPIELPFATGTLPGTTDQWSPASVDRYSPRPAS